MVADFVIAVDFDGTLERGGDYPVPGTPNYELIRILRELRGDGVKLILYTCRENRDLGIALQWCYEQAKNNLVAAEQNYNEHGADTSVKLCCPICGKKLEGTSCPDCGVDL